MSISPYFYIEVYNYNSGDWEKVNVYVKKKDEFVPVDIWTANGTHDMFSIVKGGYSAEYPTFIGVHNGLPINASQEIHKIFYEHCCSVEKDEFDYVPDVKFFNLAEAKLYINKYPQVQDFDVEVGEDEPLVLKENPLKMLIDRVESFLDIWDEWWTTDRSWSDVRVIYWLNR